MKDTRLIDLFQRARRDNSLAVIEGVQALKHAVRFGAKIKHYITCDIDTLQNLLEELAEDVRDTISEQLVGVSESTFNKLSPQPHRTKVMALATRKEWNLDDIKPGKPIIFLEDPRDLENIGAVIRVSAAADAGAVVISGPVDIWQPAVIRGAAGLQWAVPVFDTKSVLSFMRTQESLEIPSQTEERIFEILRSAFSKDRVIALDPTGADIKSVPIDSNSILIFGTERHGISKNLLAASDEIVRLPMKEGVSSLNLATSVAATLYQL